MTPLELLLSDETPYETSNHQWRPRSVLPVYVSMGILKDVLTRMARVDQAWEQLMSLREASAVVALRTRMTLRVRQALIKRGSDHVVFLHAVSCFYNDYRKLLEHLFRLKLINALPSSKG